MSDATTLIRKALDAGVELQFIDGQLRVTGRRSAVTAWAPMLRAHKDELIEALQPEPMPPAVDWKPLADAYHRHHFSCATCCAAGKGYGLRCGAGLALWSAYSRANEETKDNT